MDTQSFINFGQKGELVSMYFYYLSAAGRPETGDYKVLSVCPFITFYKKLHTSFVYEHEITKPTQNGMSVPIFGLILKNNMAVVAVFRLFFIIFPPFFLRLYYSHISQTFKQKLTFIKVRLRKVFLERLTSQSFVIIFLLFALYSK